MFRFISTTRIVILFRAPLNRDLLLSIFVYCAIAQTVMVTGSNLDSIDVDTPQKVAEGHSTDICTERRVSDSYEVTTSNDGATRQLDLTHAIQSVIGGVTVVNSHSPEAKTLGPFSVANNLSIDVRQKGTDVMGLLRNDTRELDPQSNATQSATVRELGTSTFPLVEEEYWQDRLTETLGVYVPPFLIIIGTLGNFLSVITLQSRHFRFSSTGFILTALSALDIALLNTGLMRNWLKSAFSIDVRDLSRFSCKVHIFLTYYLHQLASWTLILLTSERTIALWFPLRCKELCSRCRIVLAWLVIAAVLFAENSLFFPGFDLEPHASHLDENNMTKFLYSCQVRVEWDYFFHNAWRTIDAIVGDFFPFLVILIGNTLTIIRIIKSHWERKTQMGAASASKPMTSTTAMLIGISAMFLILNLPIDVLFLYYANTDQNSFSQEENAIYNLVYAAATLLYYANNALDFLMYLVSGGRFRQAFLETFLPCRKITRRGTLQRSTERSCNGK